MYLGVDLGTSSLKILLCDRDGKMLGTAKVEYACHYPNPGWSEQNPQDWYNAFVGAVKTLGKKHDITQIKAVSFCGHMHGLVTLDKEDAVIRPCILWNDNRSVSQTEQINTHFEGQLLDKFGSLCFVGFTAPKLLWMRQNEPQNHQKIAKIMLPKDYLLYRVSGIFASDVTDNSGTLYFEVQSKKWSMEMCQYLGIQAETQLPKIFESFQVVGIILPKVAKECGLSSTVKVVAGGGDQAVGAIGTGTV
ncbi:MAG: FGGY family carbohydrate kinase, partial [Firmicutes bacterium]|nr:FGGY family carbohydrate kinase [Bacillota bacterium]